MTKVLIVEDNEMNRDMLSRRLKRRNFEVDLAINGQAAIDFLENSMPDIILMDMRMPVMDGWTATEKIKANPEKSHIPVIGLSANAMDGDKEKALLAGCNDYVTKPINLDILMEVIQKHCPKAA